MMLMTGQPTLRQLRTFIAAIETGSVTEGARSLNLTQPAASQQLRELERILRLRLLERADGRIIPTAAGSAILDAARRTEAAAAEITSLAAAFRSGETGRIRLGTGATACIFLLPSILAAARQRMPGLEIIVLTGNSPDIIGRIAGGSLDAGLVTMPRRISRALHHEPVLHDPLLALLREGSTAAGTLTPAALAAMPLILFEPGGDTRGIVDEWFRKAGLMPRPIMELGSVEAIKVLVASGLGASVLPSLSLRQPIQGAETRLLRPKVSRELGLLMRKEKLLDRGLRVLIEAFRARAREPARRSA